MLGNLYESKFFLCKNGNYKQEKSDRQEKRNKKIQLQEWDSAANQRMYSIWK